VSSPNKATLELRKTSSRTHLLSSYFHIHRYLYIATLSLPISFSSHSTYIQTEAFIGWPSIHFASYRSSRLLVVLLLHAHASLPAWMPENPSACPTPHNGESSSEDAEAYTAETFCDGHNKQKHERFESGPAQHAYLTTRRFVGKDSRGGTFLILLDLCGMMYAGSFFPCLVTFLYHIDAGISRIDAFSRDQYSTLVISQRLFSVTILLPFNTYANYLGKLFFFYMLGPTDDVGGLYLYR